MKDELFSIDLPSLDSFTTDNEDFWKSKSLVIAGRSLE